MDFLIDALSLAQALGQGAGGDAAARPATLPAAQPATLPAARPVVLDVRWRLGGPPGIDSYREGHIPGAVFLDLDSDLCGPPGAGGRHPLPAAAAFQQAMRDAGVRAGGPVVVYDDADSTAAARAWWTLRYFGHHEVRVLDGGFRAWSAAGQPVERGERPVLAGDFTARPGGMPILDATAAGRLARHGVLLDARAAERYRGEEEPVDPVAGHIPGAVTAPTAGNVRGDGVFRPADELRARFASVGLVPAGKVPGGEVPSGEVPGGEVPGGETQDGGVPGGEVPGGGVPGGGGRRAGAYCGSGVTAAHEVLALAVAGIPAALYVGSWSEWVTDPDRPIATGPQPG